MLGIDLDKIILASIGAGIFFLVLTRTEGVKQLFNSLTLLYTSALGTIQGRQVTIPGGANIGGIAR